MTERDDHIFDNIIRNKLASYKEPVPDEIWKYISKKRKFRSFLLTYNKLIVSTIIVTILALVITISMTYKTKSEKGNLHILTIKSTVNSVLLNNPATDGKISKKHKTEGSNKISIKLAVQTKPIADVISINKSTNSTRVKTLPEGIKNIAVPKSTANNSNTITPNRVSKVYTTSTPISAPVIPANAETSYSATSNRTTPAQPDIEVNKPDKTINKISDTQSIHKYIPETRTDNNIAMKPVVQTQKSVLDSNTSKLPENTSVPAVPLKFHFRCLDFIFSPGYVTKSIKASNPASESYARMLDRVTKTRYSLGFEIKYRYYLNQFWNVATGLMYNQVREQIYGQTKPEQIMVKHTTGIIMTPFEPPKKVTIIDTIRLSGITISQNNTFSYLRIPALLGANFSLFKIPLNLYAGAEYFYSIKQQGAYINSATLESTDFQTSLDNPYKNAQGLSILAGINASKQLAKRSAFFIGVNYSRYIISINDKTYQFQQYYAVWNINLGITYQLY